MREVEPGDLICRCAGRLPHAPGPACVATAKDNPAKRPQDVAQKKLDHARQMVSEKTKQMRRLATSLRLWERRVRTYAKRASLTDAEIAAERQRRIDRAAQPRKVRRGIKLGGAL